MSDIALLQAARIAALEGALRALVDAVPGTAVDLASREPYDLARAVIQARAALNEQAAEAADREAAGDPARGGGRRSTGNRKDRASAAADPPCDS